jgi:hypothetical protein
MVGRHLGDIGILAKLAAKVAAHGGHGIGKRSGQKVIEGFFFNRIDMLRNQFPIYQRFQTAALVFPYTANSPPPLFD